VFDDLKKAIRNGTFDKRGVEPPRETTALTVRQFSEIYKERHVFAKKLAIGKTIDYRLRLCASPTSRHAARRLAFYPPHR